jgi:hypothetical protein
MVRIHVTLERVHRRDRINTTGKFLDRNISAPFIHFSVIYKIISFHLQHNSVTLRTAIVWEMSDRQTDARSALDVLMFAPYNKCHTLKAGWM